MTAKSRMIIVMGLVLTLVGGSLPYPLWDNEFADVAHLVGNECIYWALVIFTLTYVVFVEKRRLSSVGFRLPRVRDVLLGIAFAVATVTGLGIIYLAIFPILHIDDGHSAEQLLTTPAWWLAISVVRAGVSEEILFRAYPIERLYELTGNRYVAAGVPLAVFSLAHVPSWGWTHVLVAAFGGAVLTGLYVWRRNLWVNIFAHCVIDGLALASA